MIKIIKIIYNPGAFGAMVEGIIRRFSNEYQNLDYLEMSESGSFHTFSRTHIIDITNYDLNHLKNLKIFNIVYPGISEGLSTVECLDIIKKSSIGSIGKTIFIYPGDINDVMSSWVLLESKIKILDFKNSFMTTINKQKNIQQWNKNYISIQDMQIWELREYLSIQYQSIFQDILTSQNHIDQTWLSVKFSDLYADMISTMELIFKYCGLTWKDKDQFFELHKKWQSKQSSILLRFNEIKIFVENVLTKKDYQAKDFDLLQESLIQYLMRSNGYEIYCHQLEKIPTSSQEFQKIIYSI